MAKKLPDIAQQGKRIYLLIRTDPDAASQLRQLVLALCVCLAAAYATQILLVQPRMIRLEKKVAHIEQLDTTGTETQNILLSARLYTLQQELSLARKDIAVLSLQEELLREQWRHQGNNVRFHEVIFTLEPDAPLTMQPFILKTSQGETRSDHGFDLHPLSLEGRCAFPDFYRYLHYLEASPEIGFLDSVELTAVQPQNTTAPTEVSFKLSLGRLEISDEM